MFGVGYWEPTRSRRLTFSIMITFANTNNFEPQTHPFSAAIMVYTTLAISANKIQGGSIQFSVPSPKTELASSIIRETRSEKDSPNFPLSRNLVYTSCLNPTVILLYMSYMVCIQITKTFFIFCGRKDEKPPSINRRGQSYY